MEGESSEIAISGLCVECEESDLELDGSKNDCSGDVESGVRQIGRSGVTALELEPSEEGDSTTTLGGLFSSFLSIERVAECSTLPVTCCDPMIKASDASCFPFTYSFRKLLCLG